MDVKVAVQLRCWCLLARKRMNKAKSRRHRVTTGIGLPMRLLELNG
jgi:hypothetical protein